MRKTIYIALLVLVLASFGCGGGGGGGVSPHAPVISNLQYSPKTTSTLTTTVTGTIDFSDIDGNISTFTLNIYASNGSQLESNTYPISGASGAVIGYFNITVDLNTSVPGLYTFGIHITDSEGLQSNELKGPFTVIL